MPDTGWENSWEQNPTLLANRDNRKSGFAPYGNPVPQSGTHFGPATSQASASPLQQAMRAADIRTELEEMDDMSTFESDDDSPAMPAQEAPLMQPSLEELLEAEMAATHATNTISGGRDSGSTYSHQPDIRDDSALADLATHEVARACRDIVDDARTEAILNRISQKRREAAEILRLRALGASNPADDESDNESDESEAANAPTRPGPEYGIDIAQDPPTRNFLFAFNARRLAYATAMIAIMAGSATVWKYGPPLDLVALAVVEKPSMQAEALPQDERMADTPVQTVTVSSAIAEPVSADASRMPETLPASREDWSTTLAERLGPAPQTPRQNTRPEPKVVAQTSRQQQEAPSPTSPQQSATSELAFASEPAPAGETARKAITAITAIAQPQPPNTPTSQAPTSQAATSQAPTANPVAGEAGNTNASGSPLQARKADEVDLALASAMGLESLSEAARARLREKLVAGECLAPALAEAFGQVPVLAMRDLVQKLDSGC
ncbi:MAG: hypothetical protein R3D34_14850 [Nitratireductor sp.]